MSSTNSRVEDYERANAVHAVVHRYRRLERPLSWLVVVSVGVVCAGVYTLTSLVPAVAAGVLAAIALRVPVWQSSGTMTLYTNDAPDRVVESFTGPRPPVLAFQWGLADDVEIDGDSVCYEISYLFGLRTIEVVVRAETVTLPNGDRQVELTVTEGGHPWGTYAATIGREAGHTAVTIEYTADQRFGLRRVPQQLLAARYRDEALSVQGYDVVDRTSRVGR
jgi:hypothetical protein